MYTLFDRLEEDGQTTLGPALLLSVQLASQAPGSKVAILQDYVINTVCVWVGGWVGGRWGRGGGGGAHPTPLPFLSPKGFLQRGEGP